jgi:hypothetical protein
LKQAWEKINIDFKYREFGSHDEIMDYIGGSDYRMNDDYPGVCFGFSVSTNTANKVEVKLIFNGHF